MALTRQGDGVKVGAERAGSQGEYRQVEVGVHRKAFSAVCCFSEKIEEGRCKGLKREFM